MVVVLVLGNTIIIPWSQKLQTVYLRYPTDLEVSTQRQHFNKLQQIKMVPRGYKCSDKRDKVLLLKVKLGACLQ